jgi:hypothetical protein
MSEGPERYARQKSLPGVGEPGQARIARCVARIPAGPAAAVELAYLVRAGVERAFVGGPRERRFSHAGVFAFCGPRDLATGAEGALVSLCSALDNDEEA